MIGPSGDAVVFAMLYMAAGALLAFVLLAAAVLILWGVFRGRPNLRKTGYVALSIWLLPACAWGYYWLVITERDLYRTLEKAESMYGVPLPAGAKVNYRKYGRRVQWATLPTEPATIGGVDYTVQVNFCHDRRAVCRGVLARDREIDGIPCRAQAEVVHSEKTGRLEQCTLARDFIWRGERLAKGTIIRPEPGER